MKEPEERSISDRRIHPTPILSRYTLWGRRSSFRRNSDRQTGGYVDRYNPKIFFILVLIVFLNLLDALFTSIVLSHDGWELNPIVRAVIERYGNKFWIWKFAVVSSCVVILCLHSKFRRVEWIITGLCSTYALLILYQIYLIVYCLP